MEDKDILGQGYGPYKIVKAEIFYTDGMNKSGVCVGKRMGANVVNGDYVILEYSGFAGSLSITREIHAPHEVAALMKYHTMLANAYERNRNGTVAIG